MRYAFFLLMPASLLLLSCDGSSKSGVTKQSPAAIQWQQDLLEGRDLAEAHFQLATLYRNEADKLPLLLWHLQEFLQQSAAQDERRSEVHLLLEHFEEKYFAELQARFERSSTNDKDLKIRFLSENNQQLKQWITRLNRENFALRDLLLDKEGGIPLRRPTAAVKKPAPKPEPEPEKKSRVHQVVAGDTLSKIAQRYYDAGGPSEIRTLLLANPELEKNPNQLKVGDKIIIPPAQD